MYNSVACKIHLEVKSSNHFQALKQAVELLLTIAIINGTITTTYKGNHHRYFLLSCMPLVA